MADEIEDYWDGLRPTRPSPTISATDPEEKKVAAEATDEPSFTQSDLEAGLRAISRYRTELAQGAQIETTQEELDELERILRRGLGVPDSIPFLTPLGSLHSWLNTTDARVAFGLPTDTPQNLAITNLIRAFEVLGFRCEAWVEDNIRLHVALTDLSRVNWSAHQLTMGGMQLVLDLQR